MNPASVCKGLFSDWLRPHSPGLAIMISAQFVLAQSPNSVTTTVYSEPGGAGANMVATSFQDGIGRGKLSLKSEGAGDVVTGTAYDGFGRPFKVAKPFYSEAYSHQWQNLNVIDKANEYYNGSTLDRPNGGSKAFKETEYASNPLRLVHSIGEPGTAFGLASGHAAKSWRIGIATETFLGAPSDATLDAWRPAIADNFPFALEIAKDANGKFSQLIKDRAGRILRTWSDPDPAVAGNEVQTQNIYDGKGNLVKTYLPGASGVPDPNMFSTYTYNSTGQLLSEKHPDQGLIEYVYDSAGRLRFTRTEKQRSGAAYYSNFNYVKYDVLGRDVEQGEALVPASDLAACFSEAKANIATFPVGNGDALAQVKIRKFYDRADGLAQALEIPAYFLGETRNLRGRLSGLVSYDDFGQGSEHRVAEFYSYDMEGRVETASKFIPGLPVQENHFYYDFQGHVAEKFNSRNDEVTGHSYTDRSYNYDANGRMTEVMMNWDPVIRYTYSKTGMLTRTDYLKDGNPIGYKTSAYNIRGWLLGSEGGRNGQSLYAEDLEYEVAGAPGPQFNGNVAGAKHRYWLPSGLKTVPLAYKYDGSDRLVATYESGAVKEGMEYDSKGRIYRKLEGTVFRGPYEYSANTNKVVRVANHPTRANTNGNFVYDPDGNMVFDRSKSMAVAYNWRGLPYRFRFFKTIPATVINWTAVENLGPVRAEVEMVYDAGGNRALKRTTNFP